MKMVTYTYINPEYVTGVPAEKIDNEINLTSIYSALIGAAGRYCEYYASDILIEIDGIREDLSEGKFDKIRRFGFRKAGVDHNAFIDARGGSVSYYRAIWRLVYEADTDYPGQLKATLYNEEV